MKALTWFLGLAVVAIGGLAAAVFFGLGFFLSPQDELRHVDAIVAISGGETAARTQEAVRLYRQGWAEHLIFAGAAADPNGPSNARAMANIALASGVPESAIELDETSADTRENAAHVAEIARADGYQSLILVTSPYHQRRAALLFRRALPAGFVIVNHSAPDQTWRRAAWWATESSLSLTLSETQKVVFEYLSEGSK